MLYLLDGLVQDAKQTPHGSELYHHTHGMDGHTQQGDNVGVTQLSKNSHFLTKIPENMCMYMYTSENGTCIYTTLYMYVQCTK